MPVKRVLLNMVANVSTWNVPGDAQLFYDTNADPDGLVGIVVSGGTENKPVATHFLFAGEKPSDDMPTVQVDEYDMPIWLDAFADHAVAPLPLQAVIDRLQRKFGEGAETKTEHRSDPSLEELSQILDEHTNTVHSIIDQAIQDTRNNPDQDMMTMGKKGFLSIIDCLPAGMRVQLIKYQNTLEPPPQGADLSKPRPRFRF